MKFLWTTINVKCLDESIAFYSDLLGLRVLQRFPAGPGVEIAMMGSGIDNETLIELLEDSGNRAVGFTDSVAIGFAVDSVEAMLETVKSKNIPVHGGPIEMPRSVFFYIQDPNGLNVQLFQRK